jgi:hypothetical protein
MSNQIQNDEPRALATGATLGACTAGQASSGTRINRFSASGRCRLTLCLIVALISHSRAIALDLFDDIEFWVGSGANQAALVLDWNGNITTDNSLAWGFRWDGATPKTVDMVTAIVTADPRLYAKMGPVGGFGIAVIGAGYDANNDGQFAIDDDTFFDERGIASSGPEDGAVSVDPGDWYAEGWFVTGFWQYGVATGNPFDGGSWARSGSGISSRDVLNNTWHSLAFTPTFNFNAFAQNPIAAPVSGDADFDGDGNVDGRDFLAWQRGFGLTSGALPEQGDANGDGAVNAADLDFWSAQYGSEPLSALRLPPSALNSIPEPSTGLLIPFVVLLTCCTRSKRK